MSQYEPGINLTGLLIICISGIILLFGLIKESRLLGSRWNSILFGLLFLVIAPINENINDIIFYNGLGNSKNSFIISSLIVLSFSIFLTSSIILKKSTLGGNLNIHHSGIGNILLPFAPWVLGLIYLYFVDWEYGYLLLREPKTDTVWVQINYLFADRFIRLLISITTFIIIISNYRISTKVISFIGLLIFAFPTATPRFVTIIIYLPFILLLLDRIQLKKFSKNLLNLSLLIGVPLAFSVFNYFRSYDYLITYSDSDIFDNLLNAGHLDAFQSLQNSIDYVDITYGNQLIGALLFFIPRSYWFDKPIGSSSLMAEASGLTWSNVSMSYFSEGYINFGFPGVFIFMAVLIFILTMNDRLKINNLIIKYYFPATIFVLLRGDLMSSFTFILPIIFLNCIFNFYLKNKHN